MSAFSVFIPSVYKNITANMISETFHRMDVGKVKHIDLVSKNKNQNKAYVYFDALYQSELAMSIYSEVKDENSSKLQYGKSEHVYWILLQNRNLYDGVSCVGEYIEPEFTEEELAFMENHLAKELNIESFDVLDMNYVRSIEQELANARNAIAQLQFSNATLYNNNIMLGQRSMMTNQISKRENSTEDLNLPSEFALEDNSDGGPLTMEDLCGHEVVCA